MVPVLSGDLHCWVALAVLKSLEQLGFVLWKKQATCWFLSEKEMEERATGLAPKREDIGIDTFFQSFGLLRYPTK